MAIRIYEIGKLYTRQVRDLHHRCGVTIRETRSLFESRFYISMEDRGASVLIATLDRFIAQFSALDAEEEAEEQRRIAQRSGHWLHRIFGGQSADQRRS